MLGSYTLAECPLASDAAAGNYSGADSGLTITISGLSVAAIVADNNSVSIDKELGKRSTLSLTLVDKTVSYHIDPGEEIIVLWNGERIFAGKVETVDEFLLRRNDSVLIINIEAADWSRMFDRFYVANTYADMTLTSIIVDILENQSPLADSEGIIFNSGACPDVTITKANFNYKKVSDCLRDLCQLSALDWEVTPSKELIIYDRATYSAPWTIGDDGLNIYRSLNYNRQIGAYRNAQYMRAGTTQTDEKTETFRGDAASTSPHKRRRTFTCSYAIDSIVSITRISSGGVPTIQRVGIKGVDKDDDITVPEWKEWFYRRGEKEISQNSYYDSEAPEINPTLSAEETLEVVYIGQMPSLAYEVNRAEVTLRADRENGSGLYESYEEDEEIDTLDLARERATRLLEQYGRIPGVLSYEVDLPDIEPGHLQQIEIAALNIDAEFMVSNISITFPSMRIIRCTVEAMDGERPGGWFEYWTRLIHAGRRMELSVEEVVAKSERPYEIINFDDDLRDSENTGEWKILYPIADGNSYGAWDNYPTQYPEHFWNRLDSPDSTPGEFPEPDAGLDTEGVTIYNPTPWTQMEYFDVRLQAGPYASDRGDNSHHFVIGSYTEGDAPCDWLCALYQGNPAEGGTLLATLNDGAWWETSSNYPDYDTYAIDADDVEGITDYTDLWIRIYLGGDDPGYEEGYDVTQHYMWACLLYKAGVVLHDYTKDPYTIALFGVVTQISGEEIPMAVVGRSIFGEPYVAP